MLVQIEFCGTLKYPSVQFTKADVTHITKTKTREDDKINQIN